jgi:uncharacterized membrane protein YdjX (TVP38/TMEM64 family)
VLFVAAYALASAAFVPAGLLTLGAGALFGLVAGTVYAFVGAVLGACLAFSLARSVGRARVERYVARHPRLAAVRRAVGIDGRRVVMLLRLSPVIPFNAINVVMGVTPIRFTDFLVACVGMFPVTALYVYYGTVAGTLARASHERAHHDVMHYVALAIGLVATIVATTLVMRGASRALEAEVPGQRFR